MRPGPARPGTSTGPAVRDTQCRRCSDQATEHPSTAKKSRLSSSWPQNSRIRSDLDQRFHQDLIHKMVVLICPRQVGKTTLSRQMMAEGLCFENAVACMLLKHVQFKADALGQQTGLHYLRTKDGAEVDFAVSEDGALTELTECRLSDAKPHKALQRFGQQFEGARAVQLVLALRQEEDHLGVQVRKAADWLAALSA